MRAFWIIVQFYICALPLFFIMFICILLGVFDSNMWYKRLLPIVATLFLLFPFMSGSFSDLFGLAFFFCFEALCFSLMYTCVIVSRSNGWEPQVVFAVALLPEFVGLGMGYGGGMLLHHIGVGGLVTVACVSTGALYLLGLGYAVIESRRFSRLKQAPTIGESCVHHNKLALLTPRETEVFNYLARGYSVPAISRQLGLSPNTVKGNVSRIYAKLDVHSKQDLIEFANGLKSDDDTMPTL